MSLATQLEEAAASSKVYTYGCGPEVEKLVKLVRSSLTDDLRKKRYKGNPIASAGHCYVASEAIFHMLGGKEAGWKPMSIKHEGEPHWFLVNTKTGCRIDATQDQFCAAVPASQARGKGFLTKQPSKRAQQVIDRVRAKMKGE